MIRDSSRTRGWRIRRGARARAPLASFSSCENHDPKQASKRARKKNRRRNRRRVPHNNGRKIFMPTFSFFDENKRQNLFRIFISFRKSKNYLRKRSPTSLHFEFHGAINLNIKATIVINDCETQAGWTSRYIFTRESELTALLVNDFSQYN